MRAAYYNEIDPYAAQWLRNLIDSNLIAPGDVDERSIADVKPDDLAGYAQCHFFAGIGGWSIALRLAGWHDDRPVWTGSCPCQPFSAAGAGKAAMTNATCGLRGFLSSRSGDLQSSLESRLKQRLDGAGSTLFSLTWRAKATPAGRPYCQLAASALRISDSDCGSWPTTQSRDGTHGGGQAKRAMGETRHGSNLDDFALLASWPTPAANEPGGTPEMAHQRKLKAIANGSRMGATAATHLSHAAQYAAWPTPMAGTPAQRGYNEAGNTDSGRKTVALASWATPSARDFKSNEGSEDFHLRRSEQSRGKPLSEQAHQLAASGPTPNGSPAQTEKPGQLDPDHSRYLMGVQRRASKLRAYGNAIVPQVAAEFIAAYCECRP